MKTRIEPYGRTLSVAVVFPKPTPKFMAVICEEIKEGFFLLDHGVFPLPEIGSTGTIVFTYADNATKGYWKFTPSIQQL